MTNQNTNNSTTDSDPDFYFPSSSSSTVPNIHFHHQKMRKKRTKLFKIQPSSSNLVTTTKPKYVAKKPDPSAPKIAGPCTECGKMFPSVKALFGHMRCHPERQWRGINPPPDYRKPPVSSVEKTGGYNGKKEVSFVMMTAEDHEVAACLLLLANSDENVNNNYNKSLEDHQQPTDQCENDCRFECSSCKKVFGSHQALGGHRASHKNVKGCFAKTKTGESCDLIDENYGIVGSGEVVLGHKCSICLRVFSSGQALGGHKRCHWEKIEECGNQNQLGLNMLCSSGLDLNLPAPSNEDESSATTTYLSGVALDLRLGL